MTRIETTAEDKYQHDRDRYRTFDHCVNMSSSDLHLATARKTRRSAAMNDNINRLPSSISMINMLSTVGVNSGRDGGLYPFTQVKTLISLSGSSIIMQPECP